MTSDDRRLNRYWGERTPPTSKREFFNAVSTPAPSGSGVVATIRMYGPIDSYGGFWGISTKDVGEVLDGLSDEVTQIVLRINSPGGEVFEAVSILNMLRAHKATVTAVVDGLAASAASVITAGCDEAVMSPGTQLMIHKPSSFAWGDAESLRKSAGILDSVEASIIEIYSAKAGERDWAALLAEETWMTAAEAVSIGLADRVAVIPDAGETATVGEADDPFDLDEPEDRVVNTAPIPTGPGTTNRKESVVDNDEILAGLRDRLGITDVNADAETIMNALDEALTEQAEPERVVTVDVMSNLPEGAQIVDSAAFAELQKQAAEGVAARAEQNAERRDRIVADAIKRGRIAASARETWRAQLDENEDGTARLLASLPENTAVPVVEIGHSDSTESADAFYDKVAAATTTTKGA